MFFINGSAGSSGRLLNRTERPEHGNISEPDGNPDAEIRSDALLPFMFSSVLSDNLARDRKKTE